MPVGQAVTATNDLACPFDRVSAVGSATEAPGEGPAEAPGAGAGLTTLSTRSAGPSGAPKSTGLCNRAKPIDAALTCGERQCGIAMPPDRPVADCASRA